MNNRIRIAHSVCLLTYGALTLNAPAQWTFDLAGDFSASQNPHGAWSFGWMAPGSNVFHPYTTSVAAFGLALDEWRGPFRDDNGSAPPDVILNPTDVPITVSDTTWQAHRVTFHPGENGERSVIRWTSPLAATVGLSAAFEGRSIFATSGVEIWRDGELLYSSAIIGTRETSRISFNTNLAVHAGDAIDFRVNYGNGNWTSDTTQITVVLQAIPEPLLNLTLLPPFSARLAWPTNSSLYLLESATQLPDAQWVPITNQAVVIGSSFVVTINTAETNRFFRLRKR